MPILWLTPHQAATWPKEAFRCHGKRVSSQQGCPYHLWFERIDIRTSHSWKGRCKKPKCGFEGPKLDGQNGEAGARPWKAIIVHDSIGMRCGGREKGIGSRVASCNSHVVYVHSSWLATISWTTVCWLGCTICVEVTQKVFVIIICKLSRYGWLYTMWDTQWSNMRLRLRIWSDKCRLLVDGKARQILFEKHWNIPIRCN